MGAGSGRRGGVSRRALLAGGALAAALPFGGAGAADRERAHPDAPPVLPNGRTDGVGTGGSRRIKVDAKHEVWVKQVGHGPVPVLTLHGGPGLSHDYLECFEDFVPRDEVRFWYYDQLGCGHSDRPDDLSLWTVERYRDEVEAVRRALGLERFVLYGHSFGGMLALEYALAYPQYLDALVVSNMTAGVKAYVAYATELRARLPKDVVAKLDAFDAKRDWHNPEYEELLRGTLYQEHICRLDPWPEPVERSFGMMNAAIYETMQGPDEFNIVGRYKDWDRWADLHRIDVPTLLLGARHDTMSPADLRRMATLMPRARAVIVDHGSHMAMYDDQRAYFAALVGFLRERRRA
jgi:proline iminopeptidase